MLVIWSMSRWFTLRFFLLAACLIPADTSRCCHAPFFFSVLRRKVQTERRRGCTDAEARNHWDENTQTCLALAFFLRSRVAPLVGASPTVRPPSVLTHSRPPLPRNNVFADSGAGSKPRHYAGEAAEGRSRLEIPRRDDVEVETSPLFSVVGCVVSSLPPFCLVFDQGHIS